jgi:hypothetical protein
LSPGTTGPGAILTGPAVTLAGLVLVLASFVVAIVTARVTGGGAVVGWPWLAIFCKCSSDLAAFVLTLEVRVLHFSVSHILEPRLKNVCIKNRLSIK